MAIGASFASLSLERRAKRGRVATSAGELPEFAGAIGAVDDPGQGNSSSVAVSGFDPDEPSADELEFLAAGRSAAFASLAVTTDVVESSVFDVIDRPVLAPVPGTRFSGLNNLEKARSSIAAEPRTYLEPTGFAALERKGAGHSNDRAARKDVHAVKVVTRLMRAIAFRPGSDANVRLKSDELVRMLSEVTRGASAVAIAAAPLDAHRGWVNALCAEAIAELVAARAENPAYDGSLDVDHAVQIVSEVFKASETQDMAAEAIASLMSEAQYTEATSEAIAADKVRVSIGLASWDLFDNVMHPRLGLDAFRYTYGHKPEEIVALLTEDAVRIAREMNIRTSSLDSRTMHLQGSIRRVAGLLGSEYMHRTREIMNWISAAESEQEYERRCVEAQASLKTAVIPQVVELARRNFIAIELIAPQLLEESKHAHQNAQRET